MSDTAKNSVILGFVTGHHGLKGNVKVKLERTNVNFEALKTVFPEIDGKFVPFSVENIRINQSSAFIKFTDINTIDQALKLKGLKLMITEDKLLQSEWSETEYLIGFTVIDQQTGVIGKVENILALPGNTLLSIIQNGREIMIPLIKDFILKQDDTKKELTVKLPNGLIEINE